MRTHQQQYEDDYIEISSFNLIENVIAHFDTNYI